MVCMGLPDSTSATASRIGRLADHRGKVAAGQVHQPHARRGEELPRGGIGIDEARLRIEGHEGVGQGIEEHLSGV